MIIRKWSDTWQFQYVPSSLVNDIQETLKRVAKSRTGREAEEKSAKKTGVRLALTNPIW